MDLPFNLEAEKQVLSNMLFSEDVCLDSFARLDEKDFYDKRHQIIFKTLQELYKSKEKINIESTALLNKLSLDGNLEKVGDAAYIMEIADSYNDISNAKYYINTVLERSTLRKLIIKSNDIVNKWQQDSAGDISNYINKVEKDLKAITEKKIIGDFTSIQDATKTYQEHVALLKSGEANALGLQSGYEYLDNILLGFKPGNIYILAARPSGGKSTLALNILLKVAERTKRPCVMFSLEMSTEQLTEKIIACKSGVKLRNIQLGRINKNDEGLISKAIRDVREMNLYIDDTSSNKVVDMRSKLAKLQAEYGDLGLVVVDYIGLIPPDVSSKKNESRAVELGQISHALHALARDFKAPILVLSQLNREADQPASSSKNPNMPKQSREPRMSNLRESGDLEQDADVVMFIHREDYEKTDSNDNKEGQSNPDKEVNSPTTLIIAKNRNGALGRVGFLFQQHIGRFSEMEKKLS